MGGPVLCPIATLDKHRHRQVTRNAAEQIPIGALLSNCGARASDHACSEYECICTCVDRNIMSCVLTLVCALLCLTSLSGGAPPELLSREAFQERVAGGRPHFVKFFAPW